MIKRRRSFPLESTLMMMIMATGSKIMSRGFKAGKNSSVYNVTETATTLRPVTTA